MRLELAALVVPAVLARLRRAGAPVGHLEPFDNRVLEWSRQQLLNLVQQWFLVNGDE
jgi:hypothetical protein